MHLANTATAWIGVIACLSATVVLAQPGSPLPLPVQAASLVLLIIAHPYRRIPGHGLRSGGSTSFRGRVIVGIAPAR